MGAYTHSETDIYTLFYTHTNRKQTYICTNTKSTVDTGTRAGFVLSLGVYILSVTRFLSNVQAKSAINKMDPLIKPARVFTEMSHSHEQKHCNQSRAHTYTLNFINTLSNICKCRR